MKRRSLPIWLLRDVPAFLGVMISFWPLMILVIRNGFAAMRGRKISKGVFDQLPIFLAHAESRLDFALWREAYRRLGWNPRAISFELFSAPEDWADTARRFENYRHACMSLEACARGYVDHIRERFGISQREAMNAGAGPLRHAASQRATSPGVAGGGNRPRRLASLSRHATGGGGMRVLHAHAGGGLAFARGPPLHPKSQNTHLAGPTCEVAPPCLQLAEIRRALFAEGHERFHRFR
jgi:hypothetical protein